MLKKYRYNKKELILLYQFVSTKMPLKNIADTNQGFADRLKKSFDTKSLR